MFLDQNRARNKDLNLKTLDLLNFHCLRHSTMCPNASSLLIFLSSPRVEIPIRIGGNEGNIQKGQKNTPGKDSLNDGIFSPPQ